MNGATSPSPSRAMAACESTIDYGIANRPSFSNPFIFTARADKLAARVDLFRRRHLVGSRGTILHASSKIEDNGGAQEFVELDSLKIELQDHRSVHSENEMSCDISSYQALMWIGSIISLIRLSPGVRPWYFLFPVYLYERKSMLSSASLPVIFLTTLPSMETHE
jgi:hypothetical protein